MEINIKASYEREKHYNKMWLMLLLYGVIRVFELSILFERAEPNTLIQVMIYSVQDRNIEVIPNEDLAIMVLHFTTLLILFVKLTEYVNNLLLINKDSDQTKLVIKDGYIYVQYGGKRIKKKQLRNVERYSRVRDNRGFKLNILYKDRTMVDYLVSENEIRKIEEIEKRYFSNVL